MYKFNFMLPAPPIKIHKKYISSVLYFIEKEAYSIQKQFTISLQNYLVLKTNKHTHTTI